MAPREYPPEDAQAGMLAPAVRGAPAPRHAHAFQEEPDEGAEHVEASGPDGEAAHVPHFAPERPEGLVDSASVRRTWWSASVTAGDQPSRSVDVRGAAVEIGSRSGALDILGLQWCQATAVAAGRSVSVRCPQAVCSL